jgi:hypothetical protein
MTTRNESGINGHWIEGPNAGRASTVFDVRAGMLYGVLADGTPTFGAPDGFLTEFGEQGEALLDRLLPRPVASNFFLGMVRESLAAVHSTAIFGRQDTRAWERSDRYLVDDGEGNAAVVQLTAHGLVGAVRCHDPQRSLQVSMAPVPENQRYILKGVLALPILSGDAPPVSAIFWTENGVLTSAEPWYKTYHFGGEIFRRELLDEEGWGRESAEHHELDSAAVAAIIAISRRAIPLHSLRLTSEEIGMVLPRDAPCWSEAMEQLSGSGMFVET